MVRRWLAGVLTAAVIGTLGAVALSSPASANPTWYGPYRVYNSYSGLCMVVPGGSFQNGLTLETGLCYYQNPVKFFYFVSTDVLYVYNIVPEHDTSKCADTYPTTYTADGAVRQYTCDSTGGQKWYLATVGENLHKLQSTESGYCLRSYTLSAGSSMVQGYCNDHNAIWSLYLY